MLARERRYQVRKTNGEKFFIYSTYLTLNVEYKVLCCRHARHEIFYKKEKKKKQWQEKTHWDKKNYFSYWSYTRAPHSTLPPITYPSREIPNNNNNNNKKHCPFAELKLV